MSSSASEGVEAWRAVAAGWERRRELFWNATRPVSDRMVDLLAPRPGETVLELAAGLGETGFLALDRLQPGGHLISSDVAPEMVEAARRRADELELVHVEFRVLDAADIDATDASVDGELCRFGFMLVPEVEHAFSEAARVLRPGGRLALAVWAPAEQNDWISAAGRAALSLGLLEPPEPDAPGPFRLSDETRLRALLTGAGLQLEALEDVAVIWHADSVDEWWDVTRDMSRMLALLVARLSDEEVERVRLTAQEQLSRHAQPNGRLMVPGLARVALATRPAG
jgi:SAM-dependent methyltransferase